MPRTRTRIVCGVAKRQVAIAAVRLAREDISESNPRLQGVVTQCVGLATHDFLKTVVR